MYIYSDGTGEGVACYLIHCYNMCRKHFSYAFNRTQVVGVVYSLYSVQWDIVDVYYVFTHSICCVSISISFSIFFPSMINIVCICFM